MFESLLRQSGGLRRAASLSQVCGLSRPTISTYLEVLEVTHAIHLLRPYHAGGGRELVKQPKVYGFDTGFVAHVRGWNELRPEDCGQLWENMVLEHLLAQPGQPVVQYWRDRQQREVDFVVPRSRGACDAIECRWDVRGFDPRNLLAMRRLHPRGRNWVVAPNVREPYIREIDGLEVTFTGLVPFDHEVLQY